MSLRKTAEQDTPHAIFSREEAGWEWRVLKTYKKASSEAKDEYARWFLAVKSPMTYGSFELGDTYVRELMSVRPRLIVCTREFANEYPDLVTAQTVVVEEAA